MFDTSTSFSSYFPVYRFLFPFLPLFCLFYIIVFYRPTNINFFDFHSFCLASVFNFLLVSLFAYFYFLSFPFVYLFIMPFFMDQQAFLSFPFINFLWINTSFSSHFSVDLFLCPFLPSFRSFSIPLFIDQETFISFPFSHFFGNTLFSRFSVYLCLFPFFSFFFSISLFNLKATKLLTISLLPTFSDSTQHTFPFPLLPPLFLTNRPLHFLFFLH